MRVSTKPDDACTALAAYDTTGKMIRLRMIAFEDAASWAPSVIRCVEICRPLLDERHKAFGRDFWSDLDYFYKRCKQAGVTE
jgi:hypothetical protein